MMEDDPGPGSFAARSNVVCIAVVGVSKSEAPPELSVSQPRFIAETWHDPLRLCLPADEAKPAEDQT